MDIKQLIRQSNLIEGFDNPYADRLSYFAWKKLIKKDELTHDVICKAHKQITLHQSDLRPNQRGYYRGSAGNHVNVTINGRFGTAPFMVRRFMDNWLLDYAERDPIVNHIEFEKIHPFVDGNGRTGRLILWWQQQKNGLPLSEITFENRHEYYKWF